MANRTFMMTLMSVSEYEILVIKGKHIRTAECYTSNLNKSGLHAAGQYNDLATPFMSMPGDTIRHIFSLEGGGKGRQAYAVCNGMSPCHFTARSLGILSAFYLILMALASGVAVPGGLFMPSIMVSTSS